MFCWLKFKSVTNKKSNYTQTTHINSFQKNSEYIPNRIVALSAGFRAFSEWWYTTLNPVPGPLLTYNTQFTKLLPFKNVGALFEPHFAQFDGNLEEKMLLLKRTALVALLQKFLMSWIGLVLMLYFLMVAHKAACQTLSKAFLKSMKTWERSCWCRRYFSQRMHRLKICSVVLPPALKPACSSAIIFSTCGFNLVSMISSMTLLRWMMRLNVR